MNPLLLDLSFLWISVRELQQDDLEILGRLPALRYLYLKVDHENLKILWRFVVGACWFRCLVGCRLLGFMGSVAFQKGAMMRLASLAFTFHAREAAREIANSDRSFNLGMGNCCRFKMSPFISDLEVPARGKWRKRRLH
uniref:Disease resistance R13L4/SHOC-2-like LRR domain-containing protein n=1 Tax=Arundo donax TaxID=35708 RepID=A0A0A8YMJ1_ARUDO